MFVQLVETVGWRDLLELVDGDSGGMSFPKFITEIRKLALRCGIDFDSVDLKALAPMLGRSGSDDSWVSKRDVLLLRKRLNPTPLVDYTPPPTASDASQAILEERPGWNESIGTVAVYNDKVPALQRKYFSTPSKPEKKDRKPIRSALALREDAPEPSNRPAWNDCVGSMSSINDKVPAKLRNYFGEEAEKPIRDRIRRQIARNRND
jgi:hypothetical protein